jgi:hypothetical protein
VLGIYLRLWSSVEGRGVGLEGGGELVCLGAKDCEKWGCGEGGLESVGDAVAQKGWCVPRRGGACVGRCGGWGRAGVGGEDGRGISCREEVIGGAEGV